MRKSRRFCLSLVALLFSFSAISWAEVCLEDREYQELTQIFNELETINAQRQTQIETLQTAIQTSETALTQAETSREISEKETAAAQSSLRGVEISLAGERKATRGKIALAAVISVAIGFAIGLLF